MTREAAMQVLVAAFRQIAPEVDLASLDADADLREQMDIDSMDFLNAIIAVHEATGIDIPEADYGELDTLQGAIAYLAARDESA